jgi:hypothetical protein
MLHCLTVGCGWQAGIVPFAELPPTAAWRHQGARAGFEVACFSAADPPLRISGSTSAVEAGEAWAIDYEIELDPQWRMRRARVSGRSALGVRHRFLEADGEGHWLLEGARVAALDGCLDLDLESSAMTNTFPVRRKAIPLERDASAPAAYVRAVDLEIERLEQLYRRLPDEGERRCFDYWSPAFDFRARLVYDPAGLVLDYPGIAVRVL